ncbi:retrovirus-related pol polyprotein from transposon TNT 1-94, partial [Tanacetum coccineum]
MFYRTWNVGNLVVQNAVQNPGVQNVGNQNELIVVLRISNPNANQNRNGNFVAARAEVRPRRRDVAYLQTQLLISQKEEARIQLQAKEFDLIVAARDLDKIEEVNANCILISNLRQASTSVEKVNSVNRKIKETNADLTTDLARDNNQEKCFEINQEKYDKLKRCYQKSIYQEQCINKKINALHLSMASLKPDSFYHIKQKLALGYQNPFYLKQAQQKQHSLYNGKFLLEKHEPPVVYDLEETLQLAEDSRLKMKQLKKEIKLANYAKINHLSGVFVSQTAKLREELYFSNTSKTDTVSKSISIPNEKFSDDTSPTDKSLAKHKALEFEIEHLLRVVVSQDIMPIVQNPTVVETFNLQTELKHTKERFENCIIKKENEYAKLWNDWINHFKTSREENYMPNKAINSSVRTNPITISQPHVLTKKDVNSNSNGLSFKGLDITTKTRRPQPRRNTKNDRVPSASMSSCISIKKLDSREHIVIQTCLWRVDSGYSKHMTGNLKLLINFVWKFLGTVRFGNDHVVAILDLEFAFRRNTCFVRNLEGVDLLKGNRSTNLYTINLHEMASASPICLMARATSTKSWLWHQRLSHLNFDTINDLAKNDLVTGLPKFKYHKEHLCPSCEQGKSKRASHPPKPVPNSKQRLHLLHMDLCGPMRIASINGKRYVLVIVDDYSRYTWVHFLRSKDEAPEVIKTFLKRITVLLQSPVIIIRTDNGTEFKNQILKEYFDSVGISHQASSVRTPQQNGVVERRNRTLVEAARTMLIFSRAPLFLWAEAIATACYTQNRSIIHRRFNKTPYELINGRKPDISFLHVFGALCYPKNDREDIGKLGAKGDIGFFIGYSADSCAYRVYNRRTKKIMETMNVTFDELSAMAFEQSSSKPGLQSMTSGQISSGLDLTYAPSTITTQKPTEGDLDLLFEAMYDDFIGGQPSSAPRTALAAQAPQVLQTPTATTTTADSTPTPIIASSQATDLSNTSQDVDELEIQEHVQHQTATIADNVPNAMFDANTFVNPFATLSTSDVESSSSQYVDPSNMHT